MLPLDVRFWGQNVLDFICTWAVAQILLRELTGLPRPNGCI